MTPRLGAAIRFAIAMAAVNLSALAIFGGGAATTAASFATIGALYFLDYDGSARERLGAFSAATGVAVLGLLIGVCVQGNLWATVAVAFVLGFVFAAARAYRGFIARSFIGAQLAFALTVFTEHAAAHTLDLLEGWLWGAALSLIAALVIFPRHHAGKLRTALSLWCAAVAAYIRADTAQRPDALAEVKSCVDRITALDRGEGIAGLWSKRTRALASMNLHVKQATAFLELVPTLRDVTEDQRALAEATASGFEAASRMVPLDGKPEPFAPVLEARQGEFQAERARVKSGVTSGSIGTASDDDVSTRFEMRVLSIAGESVQVLAAESHGWAHPDWPLIVEPEHSVRSLVRRTFSKDSIWLFHGLRTGVAIAGAIAIATLMGLEHGVWVVMTTLSVINVTFTTSSSTKNALGAILGVFGGIAISAGLILAANQWWMLALAVPLLALLAKLMLPVNGILAQLTYTPFAVANIATLGWPSRHGLNVVRVEDIMVGVAVAVVATALTFPFGMKRLLENVWHHAKRTAEAALSATKNALEKGIPVPPNLTRAQSLAFASATDAVDAVYAGNVRLDGPLAYIADRQRWLNLAMLCQIGVGQLAATRVTLPAGDPGITVLTQWADASFATLKQAEPRA